MIHRSFVLLHKRQGTSINCIWRERAVDLQDDAAEGWQSWHRWAFLIFQIVTRAWMRRRTRWSRSMQLYRGKSSARFWSRSGASLKVSGNHARGASRWTRLMFKTLVLSALYNLSDDQVEYQIRDRLSFMRFLGLGLGDRVPDAKTVWLYREALAQAGKVDDLFKLFDGHLALQGYRSRSGGRV